jgi:hypothetical protein
MKTNRSFTWISFPCVMAGLLSLAPLLTNSVAGDAKAVLDKVPAEFEDPTGWNFTSVAPIWFGGAEGTIGIAGINTAVDAGFDDIIDHLGILAAGGIEGRNGKLGFILEGSLFVKSQVGGNTPGPLLTTAAIELEQLLAEGALTYRIFESDRGWVELLAGARYTYMSNDLTLTTDAAGVEAFSENISSEIFTRATDLVRAEVQRRLPSIIAGLPVPVADIADQELDTVEKRVLALAEGFRDPIRDGVDRGIGSDRTDLGARVQSHGPLQRALRAYVEAEVASRVEAERAAASGLVAAARAGDRAAVERRLARAEAALAKAIERRINDAIPDETIHASKAWVDPFVGFRGRYDLNDQFYLVGRGDIGGFGVSSDSAWNLYGALGTSINEKTTVEFGYRYYQVDYERGGFLYDVATKGPFIGVRMDF